MLNWEQLYGNRTNLEKRPNIDIKTEISETSCDNFGASVVSILTHFSHQYSRTATFHLYKGLSKEKRWSFVGAKHKGKVIQEQKGTKTPGLDAFVLE